MKTVLFRAVFLFLINLPPEQAAFLYRPFGIADDKEQDNIRIYGRSREEMTKALATLDSNTSDICQGLDGKVFPVKDYQAGVTAPPFHVNCRSTAVPCFKDDFVIDGSPISQNMSFEEWEKKFVKSDLTNGGNSGIIQETISKNLDETFNQDLADRFEKKFAKAVDKQVGFTDDFRDNLKAAFANGTPTARKAYIKYLKPEVIGDTAYKNGACFIPSENKIFFDVAGLNNDPRGAATIYFHEFGHLIDYRARGSGIRVSMDNPAYIKAIYKDFDNMIQNFMKANQCEKTSAYVYFNAKFFKNPTAANQISDLFNGLADLERPPRIYGHARSYWNDGSLAREAFAHMFECQFDKSRYNLMQQYFPTALAEFEKMLGGVV